MEVKLIVNQIELISRVFVSIDSNGVISLAASVTIVIIMVAVVADEPVRHFLLEFEYFVVVYSALPLHPYIQ